MKRSSGILLHITSLPSPYGIGTLGKAAFEFIDFLSDAGQRFWQVLPAGPTGYGDSPYQSFSVFAGNPYLIDLDLLAQHGLLQEGEADSFFWGGDPSRVDYGALFENRPFVFRKAFERSQRMPSFASAVADYAGQNREWIYEYAFYMALKVHFQMKPWQEWSDQGIRRRLPESVGYYCDLLEEEIRYHIFLQYLFHEQWEALRSYGKEKGVGLIGDLPIYVPLDSADVWTEPEHFLLDEDCQPLLAGGVPPDGFSETGQLWGSPVYNWAALKEKDYAFWIRRMEAAAKRCDIIRLDHFRGFESFWGVPWGEETAVNGSWLPGPGLEFIHKIKEPFPQLQIIAEDLGFLTEEVHRLVADSGFPGMKILQFAFGKGGDVYLPHNHQRNQVVYTGTHDNNTLRGWAAEADQPEVAFARKYFGISEEEGLNWGIIRGGMSSVAGLFIAQMQDYLDLPGSARMNTPGTIGGNWQWRLEKGQLSERLADRIAGMAAMYGR